MNYHIWHPNIGLLSLNNLVGYATFPEGTLTPGLTNVSGQPQSNAQSEWAFGIAATAGVTYFLTPHTVFWT